MLRELGEFYTLYINQPAPIGLAIGVSLVFMGRLNKQKWDHHDREAKTFRENSKKKDNIIEKVERYLIKFEDNLSSEKRKKVNHIITAAKNSTSIIIQKYMNYFNDKQNLKKSEKKNFQDILEITTSQMNGTWQRLIKEGYQYEVQLMKETSELLMPKYTTELELICHIYNSEGLNGSRTDTLNRLLQAFEVMVINTWDTYFRKLAYA